MFYHLSHTIYSGSLVPHIMTVSTADVEDAGTDSDVLIKVFGQSGSSEQVCIQFHNLDTRLRLLITFT